MKSQEESVLLEPRKRLIDGLLQALSETPLVFLPMKEVEDLWAERRCFENWLADAGLKLCATIIPGASGGGLYKISKGLPLWEQLKGTNWGVRWANARNADIPRGPIRDLR